MVEFVKESEEEEDKFGRIVCYTIRLDLLITQIISCLIFNYMMACNVCNGKCKYCAIMWAGGTVKLIVGQLIWQNH